MDGVGMLYCAPRTNGCSQHGADVLESIVQEKSSNPVAHDSCCHYEWADQHGASQQPHKEPEDWYCVWVRVFPEPQVDCETIQNQADGFSTWVLNRSPFFSPLVFSHVVPLSLKRVSDLGRPTSKP